MRDLKEFLSDREIYVLENHPAKTYRVLGEELGVSQSRAGQIKSDALRKIRREKYREQAEARAQEYVTVRLQRKDIYVLERAMHSLVMELLDAQTQQLRRENSWDPDMDSVEHIRKLLRAAEEE